MPSYLPAVDLWAFGSPCQGLSVAGKNLGLDDPRSGLFREAIRLLRGCQSLGTAPRYVLWANVPGVLNSSHRDDFAEVLASFLQLGARDVAWRVLDARHTGDGVAQRRRRVFVISDFVGECAGQILALGESGRRDSAEDYEKRQGEEHPSRSSGDPSREGQQVYGFDGQFSLTDLGINVSPTIRTATNTAVAFDMGGGKGMARLSNEVSPTLCTGSPHAIAYGLTRLQTCAIAEGQPPIVASSRESIVAYGMTQQQTSVVAEAVPTLTVGSDVCVAREAEPRSVLRFLTPIECERLMGWPDDHTAWGVDESGGRVQISDTARYQMCGNGVCANVSEWIGRSILLF